MFRYAHTALRDSADYHSTFGTAGFCRKGSYGMPRYVTNTMRVCTRDSINVQYDATVPVSPTFQGDGSVQFSDMEYCSDTPYDVPWTVDSVDVAHPSMFSVGNAPMYRSVFQSSKQLERVQVTISHPPPKKIDVFSNI